MGKTTYHHGDLKEKLIEEGLKLLDTCSLDQLSLRKVAVKCGVSNAAPYAHFKNKEEFVAAMQDHVMDTLATILKKTLAENQGDPTILAKLGEDYVFFFLDNPLYYTLLFTRGSLVLNFSLNTETKTAVEPFEILKETAAELLSPHFSSADIQDKVLAMWALVQGLAGIAIMTDPIDRSYWETKISSCIAALSIN
ncbi:TetR/AcrR family transcriptional regulator [Enterococcus sp. 669A]|uniref:TetR/AcrR family transcriptional regulator n=1 Tax=Candidatus Enterococcus moelleringii TaxID=2815325 RepID=A0ABS3LB67_9ENTE|nr:TetR/AcrR family transcriptional regulator [Enterococcus sp. 669A]MBO1306880.1 TetR/AcrR family transcriptional regulator [Enterococcus sp. 669A]